jgi:predicted metalloprotease with PDZ domain
LGDANNTPSYDILLHLMDMEGLQYFGGMMGALEHHTSTTVVFVDEMGPEELTQSLVDVVSHEFFHTLTPLNVHSEEIHNFEYNRPLMSQHLWMYEGTTEYFANLFQINQGLIDAPDFYNRIMEKINYAGRYDDTMSFTEMSAGIVDEPYQANYGNVYQKGALINMCLDILIREKSGGVHGILWVMKNLAKKYGKERPFKDEELIGEIVAMTYPEVGAFFEQHVIGTTPIDYDLYFSKVGLINGEVETPLRSIIFANNAELFFSPQPGAEDQMQFVVTQLNDSIEAMGVQQGDVLLGIDGALFPEINQENSGKINALLMPSLSWEADQEFSLTVERNGETLTLTGTVGTPTAVSKGLVENQDATAEAVSLREAWLFQ